MSRRKKGEDVSGWIILDKPEDMTSTHAVSAVRRTFNAQKAGHSGTLDPLASGVLPIALGEATKTVPWLMEAEKQYSFTIRWGVSTETQDREGKPTAESAVRPSREAVATALESFIGEIQQIPPQYSAVKVDGERAYDLARAGEEVELQARQVVVYEAEVEVVVFVIPVPEWFHEARQEQPESALVQLRDREHRLVVLVAGRLPVLVFRIFHLFLFSGRRP